MPSSNPTSVTHADRPHDKASVPEEPMQTGERIKIVLVEWAAYPLKREKVVGNQVVHCGLGRMLEAMNRWSAGVPMDVIVVINRADAPLAPEGVRARVRNRLERVLGIDPAREVEQRMRTYARLPERYAFVKQVHFRNNRGQDFGAYDFGYRLLQSEGYDGDVLFMNSSVAG